MASSSISLARNKSTQDARHLLRYLKFKANVDLAAIAKEDGVSVQTVRDSVKAMEAYEVSNSDGQLQLAVRDLIITTIPQAKATLHRLLNAKTTVDVKESRTGVIRTVEVDDKTTQLEATRIVGGMMASMQPKGPGQVVNVSQTTQVATQIGKAETNEERMQRLRSKAQEFNLLPPEVSGVPLSIDESDGDDDDDDDDFDGGDGEDDE